MAGSGPGVKNAFLGEVDFPMGNGHLFAPRHFSCRLENAQSLQILTNRSPLHYSERKIHGHHMGKCRCQCWKIQEKGI